MISFIVEENTLPEIEETNEPEKILDTEEQAAIREEFGSDITQDLSENIAEATEDIPDLEQEIEAEAITETIEDSRS